MRKLWTLLRWLGCLAAAYLFTFHADRDVLAFVGLVLMVSLLGVLAWGPEMEESTDA